MHVFVAPYELKPRHSLNSRVVAQARRGALLRVVDEAGGSGFADLHPWPELGDLSLEDEIQRLSEGRSTRLSARSLQLAALDREARAHGVSAFEGLSLPRNHALVTDLSSLTENEIRSLRAQGFTELKVKVGRDPVAEAESLSKLSPYFFESLKLRLDFNGVMDEAGFAKFVALLSDDVKRAVEFVEDPIPWAGSSWRRLSSLGLPLALDRVAENEWAEIEAESDAPRSSLPFLWMIIKPAVQVPEQVAHVARVAQKKIAVTSYMDHPVGQVGALLEAARLASGSFADRLGSCGLASHFAFDTNEFSELLQVRDARLLPPDGVGIGFDEPLERQAWRRLR